MLIVVDGVHSSILCIYLMWLFHFPINIVEQTFLLYFWSIETLPWTVFRSDGLFRNPNSVPLDTDSINKFKNI